VFCCCCGLTILGGKLVLGNDDLFEHLTSLLNRGIQLGERYHPVRDVAVALNTLHFYRGLHRKRFGDALYVLLWNVD
jgi:hypothetical protein